MTRPRNTPPAFQLTQLRIKDGVWEGVLTASHDCAPELSVSCGDRPPWPAQVSPQGTREWRVRIEIPVTAIKEGATVLVITANDTQDPLASFIVAAGAGAEGDAQYELQLLRSELEVLKRAFRNHCRSVEKDA